MNRQDKLAIERYQAKLQTIKSGATVNPFESKAEKDERVKAAKADVSLFVKYYLPHYATSESADFQYHLAKSVAKKPTCKILVRWGRGLAKSVWCDVIIPLWLWSRGDISYMVIVGNNFDKAKILLSDLQAEFEANPRLVHDFGEQKMQGTWEDGYFKTANGFIAKALGMGQSPRGLRVGAKRPDYIVADDLDDRETIKNPRRMREYAQWIEKDLIPTMDGPRRRFLMPNNRFAPATIQSILEERHTEWTLDQVDAYHPVTYKPAWPQKYPPEYYREMEKEVGTLAALAEYNNTPHVEGVIFTEDQIQWSKLPAITHFEHIVGHWDIAYSEKATADYNAVRLWGLKDDRFYLLDCFVKQSKMRGALEWIVDTIKRLPGNIRIRWQYESQFWNDEVQRTIDEVEEKYHMDLRLRKVDLPRENKYDRIVSTQPYYQNSRVFYSDKLKGHNDTQVGIAQLCGIEPNYKTKDDAPDADERCFAELSQFSRRHKAKSRARAGSYNKNNSRKG